MLKARGWLAVAAAVLLLLPAACCYYWSLLQLLLLLGFSLLHALFGRSRLNSLQSGCTVPAPLGNRMHIDNAHAPPTAACGILGCCKLPVPPCLAFQFNHAGMRDTGLCRTHQPHPTQSPTHPPTPHPHPRTHRRAASWNWRRVWWGSWPRAPRCCVCWL